MLLFIIKRMLLRQAPVFENAISHFAGFILKSRIILSVCYLFNF